MGSFVGQIRCQCNQHNPKLTPNIQNKALSMTKTDQVNPGESYDPLLMSLVKSTISIRVDEEVFKPWDNWDMDCVRVPFRGRMGKTTYLSVFELGMVVGARRTGLSVSRTATLPVLPCVSIMVHHPKDITHILEAFLNLEYTTSLHLLLCKKIPATTGWSN